MTFAVHFDWMLPMVACIHPKEGSKLPNFLSLGVGWTWNLSTMLIWNSCRMSSRGSAGIVDKMRFTSSSGIGKCLFCTAFRLRSQMDEFKNEIYELRSENARLGAENEGLREENDRLAKRTRIGWIGWSIWLFTRFLEYYNLENLCLHSGMRVVFLLWMMHYCTWLWIINMFYNTDIIEVRITQK